MTRIKLLALTTVVALTLGTAAATAAPATLQASPKHLNFGTQIVGTQTTLTVTVTNTTSETVTIVGATLFTEGVFDWDLSQLTGNTCAQVVGTLPPGASCTAPMLFAPTAPGHYRGALLIDFQIAGVDAADSPLKIRLSGRAVSAT
jgi:hypothetical protein